MTEEERAALHRAQRASRIKARAERFVALAGDPEARLALDIAWQPVLLARFEAQLPPVDPCVDSLEELYVEVPERNLFRTEIPEGQVV